MASFRVAPASSPPAIDLTMLTGAERGQTAAGIYRLKDSQLTICLAASGKSRPQTFITFAGSGRTVRVYRRKS
jgi:uncharacterized protein (TIGR03067 family)